MCVTDLRGDRFLSQLRRAHDEGLLTELMQAAELQVVLEEYLRLPSDLAKKRVFCRYRQFSPLIRFQLIGVIGQSHSDGSF
jgi:hypothetical protein